jgi:5-methylcytosine-specific restriction endonuclease McrBC regulatory subunit McrC
MKEYRFKLSGRSRIGFIQTRDKKFTFVVVPRFWFAEQPQPGSVLRGGIILLPDKGERTIYSESLIGEISSPNLNYGDSGQLPHIKIPKPRESDSEGNDQNEDEDNKKLLALILLLWKYNKKKNYRSELITLSAGAGNIHIVLAKSLLHHISQRMRELRRTYKAITVNSSFIRGRIDVSASAKYIAGGIPQMVCRTDDFTLRSEHYSALMTALEVIVNFPVLENDLGMSQILNDLKKEARQLRSVFREIPSLSPSRAIVTLSNSRVPPQLRQWQDIFQYALLVLQRKGSNTSEQKLDIRFPFATLSQTVWEQILEQLCKKVFGHDKVYTPNDKQDRMVNPWQFPIIEMINDSDDDSYIKRANKRPDLKIHYDNKIIILDAKYYDNISKVISSSGYQLMGYALLPWKEVIDRSSERVLFFAIPKRQKLGSKVEINRTMELEESLQILDTENAKIAKKLHGLKIEFPSPDVFVNTQNDWWSLVAEQLKSKLIIEEE